MSFRSFVEDVKKLAELAPAAARGVDAIASAEDRLADAASAVRHAALAGDPSLVGRSALLGGDVGRAGGRGAVGSNPSTGSGGDGMGMGAAGAGGAVGSSHAGGSSGAPGSRQAGNSTGLFPGAPRGPYGGASFGLSGAWSAPQPGRASAAVTAGDKAVVDAVDRLGAKLDRMNLGDGGAALRRAGLL